MQKILFIIKSPLRFLRKIIRKILSLIEACFNELTAKHIEISVHEMFMQQNTPLGYNRLDTVVRFLAIENYYGINDYGFSYYKKMQGARIAENYVEESVQKFKTLIASWHNSGYKRNSEITCDSELMLIDGSHRMALAMYHNIPEISCKVYSQSSKITYGVDWFIENNFTIDEIKNITDKCKELLSTANEEITIILWPPVLKYFNEITQKLEYICDILNYQDYKFRGESFDRLVYGVYHIDDIEKWKISKKIEKMKPYDSKTVRVIRTRFECPSFRLKHCNNNSISINGEHIKRIFRNCYKAKVDDYYYDIIMHTGDNFRQSKYITELFAGPFSLEDYFKAIGKYKWIIIKLESDYLPEDFPKTIPFSKDLDIICDIHDFEMICKTSLNFVETNCGVQRRLRVINADGECRIRLELDNYLIFQLDIRVKEDGINNDFIQKSVSRRIVNGGYYIPRAQDELCYRVNEFINFPNKTAHLKYVLERKDQVNIDLLKSAVKNGELFCQKYLKEI